MLSMKRKYLCWITFSFLFITCFLNLTIFSFYCSTPNPVADYIVEKVDLKQLVILVMTAPQNQERRQAIRETWLAKIASDHTKVYFVLGTENINNDLFESINTEHHIHNDLLLLEDLEDSYFKLTEKLLKALAVTHSRHNSTFIMKCDDDTFIDSSRLYKKLQSMPTSRLYWGYFTGAAHVKKSGQWAEPNFHLCDRYLPYARGGGYVITRDLVEFILKNKDMLQIYNSEDVTLGVWLAPLDIKRIHDTGFDTEATSRGCRNHHLVSHKQSLGEMRTKSASLEESGRLCTTETTHKREYTYNWLASPSQCCVPGVT